MSTASEALAAPPIDALVGEMIASLALAAHAYLEPKDGEPDLAAAAMACDIAGSAFDRISPQLRPDERSALSALLTEVRLSVVRKRA